MLLLMLLILFVAAHGRSNEMMYMTLLFVFLAVALFTYGYWTAVSKGEGISQYIGKHNLQHQQMSSPNYHFVSSVPNFKGHPKSKVHVVVPPKMGGVKLEIYTLPDDCNTGSISGASDHSHHHHQQHNNQQRHYHHHHHHKHEMQRNYHQHHQDLMIKNSMVSFEDIEERHKHKKSLTKLNSPLTKENNLHSHRKISQDQLALMQPGHSCVDLSEVTTSTDVNDPIHCEVNLSRSASQYYRQRQREGFAEVNLPPLKK